MLIKMLTTRRGSEDGFVVRRYNEGVVYDVTDGLARAFICEKSACRTSLQDQEVSL